LLLLRSSSKIQRKSRNPTFSGGRGIFMFVQAGTCVLLALAGLNSNLVGGLGVTFEPRPGTEDDLCLQCEDLFSKLEDAPDGKLLQKIQLQLRGEPKSGTTFVYLWAKGVLQHTCEHLRGMYGEESCRTVNIGEIGKHLAMIFEPNLASSNASCPCQQIERVEISVSTIGKHRLPVSDSCPWSHSSG
ncbi:unnamed protein product, partial [Ectocarpus sp. 13 AM-2016]